MRHALVVGDDKLHSYKTRSSTATATCGDAPHPRINKQPELQDLHHSRGGREKKCRTYKDLGGRLARPISIDQWQIRLTAPNPTPVFRAA